MRRLIPPLLAAPLACGLAALLGAATAGDDPQPVASQPLAPRPATFSKPALPLPAAITELSAGTGNAITDPRRERTVPTVILPAGPVTFWPALDAIGRSSGVGFSPYAVTGSVALTDAPYRPVPTAYAGLFRVAVRRLAVSRDEETRAHQCQLALDVAWEPRFQPFFVELKRLALTYAPDAKGRSPGADLPGQGPVHVAGRGGIELDVIAAAPDRTSPRIATAEGTLWAVGPSKMLTFTFDRLALGMKPVQASREGVTVRVASLRRQSDALLAKIEIENPKGGYGFESHQSWLENNLIVLRRGAGGPALMPSGSSETIRGHRAEVLYEFTANKDTPLPAALDGWTLRYETPGRIVELTARFSLKDLALP